MAINVESDFMLWRLHDPALSCAANLIEFLSNTKYIIYTVSPDVHITDIM